MKKILLILSGLLVVAGCIKEEQRGSDLKVGDMIPDFEVVMNDGRVVTDDDMKESAKEQHIKDVENFNKIKEETLERHRAATQRGHHITVDVKSQIEKAKSLGKK
jgi:hypothetical protein